MSEVERYDLCEFNNGLVVRKGGFLVRAEEYDEVCERLTAAEKREVELKRLLCDVINEAPTGFAALKVDLAHRVNAAIKPAAEGEGS